MQKKNLMLLFLAVICFSYAVSGPKQERTFKAAPETFTARFETTKGDFDIKVTRKWSPKAADRFYELIEGGYYNNAHFYRVVPDFVAQFGNVDTLKMKQWKSIKVPDEEVVQGNKRGTISFARGGKESRDFDLFINLQDNTFLDTINFQEVKGFPALGIVTKGMETVDRLYSGYGDNPMLSDNFQGYRPFFEQEFPDLDLIKKAYITSKK